ncbi:lipopolysaccharide biosynthesis protein [Priestia megaterium]
MRTDNTFKNIQTALIGQSLGIILNFVSRIFFVKYLGAEYLGVNGLFTNILSLLSLADLGIGSALVYSMYKPLAANDKNQIKSLMNFYAKVYNIIGIAILILGLILLPFLNLLIKDRPNIPHLNFYYVLFLLNTVITYFYAYRRSIIIADQKNYIVSYYHNLYIVVLNIIQILLLVTTKNYFLYLASQTILIFVENYVIYIKSKKLYPYLNNIKGYKLDKVTLNTIIKNTKALIYHKIGTVAVFSTDNLVISTFIGVFWVGLYSNYSLIVSALNAIIGQFFNSFTASVGNLNASDDRNRTYYIFNVINFLNFWVIGFCSICLLCLFNPFITLWLGSKYLLDNATVLILVLNFYLMGMRKTPLIFKDAAGLFWNDRYKPIAEATVNLVASIILVKYMGLIGVFIGTAISTIFVSLWIEPYVLYKHGFKKPLLNYFIRYSIYTVVVIVAFTLTQLSSSIFSGNSILSLIGKFIVCLTIPNLIFTLIFFKTAEFNHLKNVAINLFKKVSKKQYNKFAHIFKLDK